MDEEIAQYEVVYLSKVSKNEYMLVFIELHVKEIWV